MSLNEFMINLPLSSNWTSYHSPPLEEVRWHNSWSLPVATTCYPLRIVAFERGVVAEGSPVLPGCVEFVSLSLLHHACASPEKENIEHGNGENY